MEYQTKGMKIGENLKKCGKLIIKEEVIKGMEEGRGIVALESTIISHGMEYPVNRETALAVESAVREEGAIPATIAIIAGVIKIGLSTEEIELLAKMGREVRKCSRRDLGIVIGKKGYGATTVAATMYLASLVGIKVFVTGGIGGVHRGVGATLDISADLPELAQTPLLVVSAGIKSILDIPKTLELLETLGVPVVTYAHDNFPDFFTPNSGLKTPFRLDTPTQIAEVLNANRELGLNIGMLLAVPIPEDKAARSEIVKSAIEEALKESM